MSSTADHRLAKKGSFFFLVSLLCHVCLSSCRVITAPLKTRTMTRIALEDRIRGGWAGKMVGVAYGSPTEFSANGMINESEIPSWEPEMVENAIHQDDLYVGMTMSETMDRLGLDATMEQYGEAFKNTQYDLWHANANARRFLNLDIPAPMSGHPLYNIHANDIDFQIEADFIGMMCPGLPQESNKYGERVGRVMNHGDGLYGGLFLNGMYAAAYFEKDIRKVIESGLACIPAKSEYAQVIKDLLAWSAQNPGDWKKTWKSIEEKWDKNDACPDGALRPFNIDAKINGAYVVLGLLYGEKDFAKTLEISTRAGQDSDCNPSSAAGILGVMVGYEAIPELWKSGIPALADTKFEFTNSSFNDIIKATLAHALKVIQLAGGKVSEAEVAIPFQSAVPAKLKQWDMGVPDRRINFQEPAWDWKNKETHWKEETGGEENQEVIGMVAAEAGAEVVLKFTGSAVSIQGALTQDGGRADVFVDGKKGRILDAYIVPFTYDSSLWHIYGLKQGRHTIRIVTRDDADSRSMGHKILISEAVVYRDK